MWGRPSDDYAREKAAQAAAKAEQAVTMISQHMDDCGTKYLSLRESINEQFSSLRESVRDRHSDNTRRLDGQDRLLSRMNWWLISVLVSIIGGSTGIIIILLQSGHHF